jgi:hypothetical protein
MTGIRFLEYFFQPRLYQPGAQQISQPSAEGVEEQKLEDAQSPFSTDIKNGWSII